MTARDAFKERRPVFTTFDYQALEARALAEQIAAVTLLQAFLYVLHGAQVTFLCDEMIVDFEVTKW